MTKKGSTEAISNHQTNLNASSPDATPEAGNTLHKFFRSYVEAGFFLTPLNGKIPYLFDWQTNKLDTSNPDNFPANKNYGVVLQDDDLVIDVDPRHFIPGDNPVARLVKIIGKLDSFTVTTGGGGLHIYLKKPAKLNIRRSLKDFKGVEFKSIGQQVVACGCLHPETYKYYIPTRKSLDKIANAPIKLLDLLDQRQDIDYHMKGSDEYLLDEGTIDTFKKYLVSEAPSAIEGDNGDMTTYQVSCKGKDLGLDPKTTFDLMAKLWNSGCTPPWDLQELQAKVENSFKYGKNPVGCDNPLVDFRDIVIPAPVEHKGMLSFNWQRDKAGNPRKTLNNTVCFFLEEDSPLLDLLRFNDFSKEIEFTKVAKWHMSGMPPAWSDADAISCKYWLSSQHGFEVSVNLIHEAALVLARANQYHPIKQYLDDLEWDGRNRLDTWLTRYAKVRGTKFVKAVGAKTLIAAVKRIYEPGCKFDHMLILEGKTGTKKSTLCEILGGEFYGELHVDAQNKDVIEHMRGKWILELPELEMTRRSDTQAMKAFLSRRIDRTRLAYARSAENFPRQSILIGTHNPDGHGYLQDTTGNRRYWMVEVKKDIDIDFLIRDRDQLFAEAVVRYKKKESIYLRDTAVLQEALESQKSRQIVDMWVEPVLNWLERDNKSVVTLMEVYEGALEGAPRTFTPKEQRRLSIVMKTVGWEKGVYSHPDHSKGVNAFRKKKYVEKKVDIGFDKYDL